MYENCLKRVLDFCISIISIILLFPLLLILSIVGLIFMKGNPFFIQPRPGKKDKNGNEKIFYLIKFRTMTNKRDSCGNILPDEKRLNNYGRFLRKTSLDELPQLFNVLVGDMAIVGPRPQLVKDMVFMTNKQRQRHNVLPGITGLAQISGRNNITWEQKFDFDIKYIKKITFMNDVCIIIKTFFSVLKMNNTIRDGCETDIDLCDWLLINNKIEKYEYNHKINMSNEIIENFYKQNK